MVNVHRLAAFTRDGDGGNEAGYCENIELNDDEKQRIARMVNYSETAFVGPDLTMRYFTPKEEVDLCGHATIAALHNAYARGMIDAGVHTVKTKAGRVSARITHDAAFLRVPIQFISAVKGTFKDAIGVEPLDAYLVSAGVREIYLRVDDLSVITPDFDIIETLSHAWDVAGVYVYRILKPFAIHARNFLPAIGIDEESATGTAAAGVSAMLRHRGLAPDTPFSVFQGEELFKPSRIRIGARDDAWRVEVGGSVRVIDTKTFSL